MSKATRLVRSGNLMQAVAAIREALRGKSVDVPPSRPAPSVEAPAPATPTAPGQFQSHSYSNAAGTREYKLYVPPGQGDRPMPLIVMLHGCTQSADEFAMGTRMNELAAEHGFLVAYPEQASSANPNKCWNWFKRGDQERDRGEPSLIAGIVGAVKNAHAVDERRTFVAGMSSGGALAATLAATYPDVFAAVGVHSGLPHGSAHDLPSALAAMRSGSPGADVPPARAIVFHGDRDAVVNPRNGEALFEQWSAGKALAQVDASGEVNGYRYTCRSVQDEAGRSTLEHWVVHGGGHTWFGGNPSGTHTDASGPDASREMVRFFLAA
jgi:poly(hydroxyalkanoate) depolymerase family esterase